MAKRVCRSSRISRSRVLGRRGRLSLLGILAPFGSTTPGSSVCSGSRAGCARASDTTSQFGHRIFRALSARARAARWHQHPARPHRFGPSASAAACAHSGVTPAEYGNIVNNPRTVQRPRGGNTNLKPETGYDDACLVFTPQFLPAFTRPSTIRHQDQERLGTYAPT